MKSKLIDGKSLKMILKEVNKLHDKVYNKEDYSDDAIRKYENMMSFIYMNHVETSLVLKRHKI